MTHKVTIIHRWEGSPEEDWYPWLKVQLELAGYLVEIPAMPHPQKPEINAWIDTLHQMVPNPSEADILIGHSTGSQAILRYLEKQRYPVTLGGVILVTPWIHLTNAATEGVENIAAPWLLQPINFDHLKSHNTEYTAIFSENDPFVPITDAEIFRYQLGAKIVIEKGLGHMTSDEDVTTAPFIMDSIFKRI